MMDRTDVVRSDDRRWHAERAKAGDCQYSHICSERDNCPMAPQTRPPVNINPEFLRSQHPQNKSVSQVTPRQLPSKYNR